MRGELLKGHLDYLVLAVVESGPLHGYAIIRLLAQRSVGAFDLPEGTIYPVLHRLERADLLGARWTLHAGRKRKVYRLTRKGKRALVQQRNEWPSFSRAVSAVLEPAT